MKLGNKIAIYSIRLIRIFTLGVTCHGILLVKSLLGMVTFQTASYKEKYLDSQFGWDYDELLFQSRIAKPPSRKKST